MNVDNTIFSENKASFAHLQKVLSKQYDNVSILVEKTSGRNYRFSKSGTTIKDNTFSNTGAVIRLNSSIGLYEYSFNDFSSDFMNTIPSIISENITKYNSQSLISDFKIPDSSDEFISFNKSTTYEINPADMNDSDITSKLSDIYSKAIQYSDSIIDCVCIYQYLNIHKMFLSSNKDLEQHLMWSMVFYSH